LSVCLGRPDFLFHLDSKRFFLRGISSTNSLRSNEFRQRAIRRGSFSPERPAVRRISVRRQRPFIQRLFFQHRPYFGAPRIYRPRNGNKTPIGNNKYHVIYSDILPFIREISTKSKDVFVLTNTPAPKNKTG